MSTLAELIDTTRDKIKIDPNGKQFNDTLITEALNQGLLDIQKRDRFALGYCRDVATLTPSSQETALPSDFMAVSDPSAIKWGNNAQLELIDYNQVLQMGDPTEAGDSSYAYIRYDGSDWVLGTYPVSTANTITVPYLKRLSNITSSSPLPTDYDEPMTSYAAYYCLRNIRGFTEIAQSWLVQYREALQTVSATRLTPDRAALKFSGRRRVNRNNSWQ